MASLTSLLPLLLAVALSVIPAWVAGQDTSPANYDYDCRRKNVGCENSGTCLIPSGNCDCSSISFEGHNCGLDPTLRSLNEDGSAKCSENQCENDAVCLTDSNCYCNKDTYGNKCENARIKMWCTDSQMFINVNPHGSQFTGKIYLRKTDGKGKDDTNCQLKSVTDDPPNLGDYTYVNAVQGGQPSLAGYYIVQDHVHASNATGVCQAATKDDEDPTRTDYEQQVMIEYHSSIVSSVDQIITFNCSISQTTEIYTSENAMDVTLDEDDYQPVNDTSIIAPVLFEIRDGDTDTVITNNVRLGDPLDLTFTLQTTGGVVTGSSIVEFKVTDCFATNGQPVPDEENPDNKITFLVDDCGSSGSEMLFRDYPEQLETDAGVKKMNIPLNAFRFVGDYEAVAFTCTLKLCSQDMITADPDACKAATCGPATDDGGDTPTEGDGDGETPTEGDGDGETPTEGDGDGETPTEGDGETPTEGDGETPTEGDGETPTEGDGGTPAGGGSADVRKRRKRAAGEERKNVTKTIHVTSPGGGSAQTGTEEGPEKEPDTEDCMQHSEVVIIIVIFAVILVILVLALVFVIINLLRSRQKVVDATDRSVASPQSHYSLPRLSLATTM